MTYLVLGILIPFIGTTLGAATVFLMKNGLNERVEKLRLGFAAGVMVAASVWSLILPAVAQSEGMGRFSFVPATVGVLVGVAFLSATDSFMAKQSAKPEAIESGKPLKPKRSTMLVFAVTLHNIPEGMAVGVALASAYFGRSDMTMASALVLAVGIAVQNFPEGAIISMPLKGGGASKPKAFLIGTASGAVEPIAATLTVLLAGLVAPILPYLLSFAAGAMIYVVVKELIPEAQSGGHSRFSTFSFVFGFVLMMVLDIALG